MNELLNACQEEVFRNKKLLCNTCINNSDEYISSMCLFCFRGDNFDAIQIMEKPIETLPEKSCSNCEWDAGYMERTKHQWNCFFYEKKCVSCNLWDLRFEEDVEVEVDNEILSEKGCYNCEWNTDGECQHDRGCYTEDYKEWALSFMEDVEVEIDEI